MPFKPQTKRFALVPVEPGKEKIADVEVHQNDDGDACIQFPASGSCCVFLDISPAVIAALGFPTEGEEA
jgi:hypothetical protein